MRWGNGGYGRLGHREQKDEFTPRRVDVFTKHNTLPPTTVISAGSVSSACTVGQMYIWGKIKLTGDNWIGWNICCMDSGNMHYFVGDDTLHVVPLKGYDSHHITEEHLGSKIISRFVLLCAFEGIPYLLCALGDGYLLNFLLNTSIGKLTDRKKMSLGKKLRMLKLAARDVGALREPKDKLEK
ncbi:unnamed protein product [Lactuca saligna]|uniref:Uncharacterized protein n=1 Tax=Lactuca saligna TaxID=75948 RepID=A0AA36EFD5_LACSI|nr:unnamed protein product [Lactuca saligna]